MKLKVKLGGGMFQVLEQDFLSYYYEGIVSCSCYPEIKYDDGNIYRIFLRGSNHSKDNEICIYKPSDEDIIKKELEKFCDYYNCELVIEEFFGEIK